MANGEYSVSQVPMAPTDFGPSTPSYRAPQYTPAATSGSGGSYTPSPIGTSSNPFPMPSFSVAPASSYSPAPQYNPTHSFDKAPYYTGTYNAAYARSNPLFGEYAANVTPYSLPGTSGFSMPYTADALRTPIMMEKKLADEAGIFGGLFSDAGLYVGLTGIFASIMAANKNLKEMKKEADKQRLANAEAARLLAMHEMAMLDKKLNAGGPAGDTSGATDVFA
mgnify:CR=1 FL=1